jgi:hypothetical protein
LYVSAPQALQALLLKVSWPALQWQARSKLWEGVLDA